MKNFYFIAYNKIINGYALKEDLNYNGDQYTDTDIVYDEFNDKLCEMNEHWGDIYSLSEIEEVKQAEKEKEIKLLREAIKKLEKENKELKKQLKVNNTFNTIETETLIPRYLENTTLTWNNSRNHKYMLGE